MKYALPFVLIAGFSVQAFAGRIATLLSRYGEWMQTCEISSLETGLSMTGQTFYKDRLISTRNDSAPDSTDFKGLSSRLVGASFEEGPMGSADSLYMVSAIGNLNGEEVETPVYATGERNLESTAPEATDFFYNVNFYCRNVLENAFSGRP